MSNKIKLELNINKPFSKLSIKFLNELSMEIRKRFKNKITREIFYLIFWISKKNILKLKEKNFQNNLKNRIGRGKVIHYSAQNISTNFLFSFAFGLLSGNSNVVFYPEKIKETKLIIDAIKKVQMNKIFQKIKNSNLFLANSKRIGYQKILKNPNARVMWGGDQKINLIRKNSSVDNRCLDLIFGDRYSISLIKLKKQSPIKEIVKNFYYDNFLFNQNACSSSHIIYWYKTDKILIRNFWNELLIFAKKFEQIEMDQNLNKLKKINLYFSNNKFKYIKNFGPYFTVLGLSRNYDAENLRGENGIFFEKQIKNLDDISKNDITPKLQTMSINGVDRTSITRWIEEENITGIDRIVPIGQSLDMDLIWDGHDVIRSLSRVIN